MLAFFPAIIAGVGHLAYAAVSAVESLGQSKIEFELSRDGEYLWDNYNRQYNFVGFSENGDFTTSVGYEMVSVGRKIGRVKHLAKSSVRSLLTESGEYVLIHSGVDASEVFKRVR